MAVGVVAKAAHTAARAQIKGWEREGVAPADVALLLHVESLCPEGLASAERPHEGWTLTPAIGAGEEDGWVKADESSQALVLGVANGCAKDLSAAVATADGVEQEIRWYFQERDCRIWGGRASPLRRPCARTVFARRLRRYASSSLRCADRRQLALWCEFLRRLVAKRPFSAGNLLWPSQFERCLSACLVRLEGLRRRLEAEDRRRLRACEAERAQVAKAAAQRARHSAFCKARLQQIALYRCALRAQSSLARARGQLALLPCTGSLLRFERWATGTLFAAAGLELAGQLLGDLRAYAAGELDGGVLVEDALLSAGSAAAVSLGRLTAAGLATVATSPGPLLLLELLGPGCAALLASCLVRTAGRRLFGTPGARALRGAYVALGLSPKGVSLYSPEEIEAQLAWMLEDQRGTQPGRDEQTLRLWAAYAYIREHQHPGLCDPWAPPEADALEDSRPLKWASACNVLNMDPDAPTHSLADLRQRYRQLLLVHHPDKPTGQAGAFMQIRAAYELLQGCRQRAA